MKTFVPALLIFLFAGCAEKAKLVQEMKLQVSDSAFSKADIDRAVDVLSQRLTAHGNSEAVVSVVDNSTISIRSAKLEKSYVTSSLLSTGTLEFYTLYTLAELSGYFEAADKKLKEIKNKSNDIAFHSFEEDAGTYFGQLISFNAQAINSGGFTYNAGELGYLAEKDTAVFNHFLNLTQNLFPEDCIFKYSQGELMQTGRGKGKEKIFNLYACRNNLTKFTAVGHIANARQDVEQGSAVVRVFFDQFGTKKWASLTEQAVHRCLAIVASDIVLSAPVVNMPMNDGTLQISGAFTVAEAIQLADNLNSKPLGLHFVVVSNEVIK